MRILAAVYGLVCYVVFLGSFLYAIGFVGNAMVATSIDVGRNAPLAIALAFDIALLGIFAVQHSLMARPFFKRRWTKIVPQAVERSTYVLFSSLALILLYWQWRAITIPIWTVTNPTAAAVLWAIFWVGWATVLLSTFMISHFELFGLTQVWINLRNRPHSQTPFQTPFLYGFVRHPIYLGFMLAFWATPHMTGGHLLFSVMTTAYILIAIQLEEHDLIAAFGDSYSNYRKRVSMLIPLLPKASGAAAASDHGLGTYR